MKQSKIIRFKKPISEKANLKEQSYRDNNTKKDLRSNTIEKWLLKRNDGRLQYISIIKAWGIKFSGKILELGAGSCWFSSEISKEENVKEIYCVEFSEYLLKNIAPKIMEAANAKVKKITRVIGDFNQLEFKDATFDFVIFDASLHHAIDLNNLLKEAERVLKKEGLIIAIREPVIPTLRPFLKKDFGKEDKRLGITEQIYSTKEWKNHFKNAKLNLKFVPFIPRTSKIKRLLNKFKLLNRLFFGHYIFVAKKRNFTAK